MNILIDANCLLRSLQPMHAHHIQACNATETVQSLGYTPCIVPQVLYEIWVVATRPIELNGLGLSVVRAKSELHSVLRFYRMLPDEPNIFDEWFRLVVDYEVKGKTAHDARLVAAMHHHNITHLLTFNDGDFSRFPSIIVIHPEKAGQMLPVK